ncbi:MAG: putative oxidoreductase [Myxococcota bacterium]
MVSTAVSGVLLLACGVGVALGIFMDIAALGIVGLVLIFAFKMHPFWTFPAAEKEMEMAHFMKNISIAGAASMLFIFSGVMPYTITGPLL